MQKAWAKSSRSSKSMMLDSRLITWMAPALIMGLTSRSLAVSSFRIELNASPEGSIITWEKVSRKPRNFSAAARLITLLMLWMEKRFSVSPKAMVSPSMLRTQRPTSPPSALASSGI